MPATARVARADLPMPIARNDEMGWGGELEAVDALYAAYMALNAVGRREGRESHLAWEDGPQAPMALTAKAARAALARIPGVGARQAAIIWEHMVNNGSDAQWNYDLWRKGQI